MLPIPARCKHCKALVHYQQVTHYWSSNRWGPCVKPTVDARSRVRWCNADGTEHSCGEVG